MSRAELEQTIMHAANQSQRQRAETMPTEWEALLLLNDAYTRLRELGWRDARYAPCDPRREIEVIEAGSTGIFHARRDAQGYFWVTNEDETYPSEPILWRDCGE